MIEADNYFMIELGAFLERHDKTVEELSALLVGSDPRNRSKTAKLVRTPVKKRKRKAAPSDALGSQRAILHTDTVRDRMRELGKTNKAIADALGVHSPATVTRYLGGSTISVVFARQLASILGIEPPDSVIKEYRTRRLYTPHDEESS